MPLTAAAPGLHQRRQPLPRGLLPAGPAGMLRPKAPNLASAPIHHPIAGTRGPARGQKLIPGLRHPPGLLSADHPYSCCSLSHPLVFLPDTIPHVSGASMVGYASGGGLLRATVLGDRPPNTTGGAVWGIIAVLCATQERALSPVRGCALSRSCPSLRSTGRWHPKSAERRSQHGKESVTHVGSLRRIRR